MKTNCWRLVLKRIAGVEAKLKLQKLKQRQENKLKAAQAAAEKQKEASEVKDREKHTAVANIPLHMHNNSIGGVYDGSKPLSQSPSIPHIVSPASGNSSGSSTPAAVPSSPAPSGSALANNGAVAPNAPSTSALGSLFSRLKFGNKAEKEKDAALDALIEPVSSSSAIPSPSDRTLANAPNPRASHQHFALTIEVPNKDSYVVTVEGKYMKQDDSHCNLQDLYEDMDVTTYSNLHCFLRLIHSCCFMSLFHGWVGLYFSKPVVTR